jgi:hypothetical protein
LDPLTLTVEIIGAIIVLLWSIVPAREFIQIYRHLKTRNNNPPREDPGETR